MSGESPRWQGPKSDFPWEEDALKHIRDQMPDAEPYRAWQTFTFTAPSSHVREVDLFLAAPGGLFLVEIKSHPGTARNNGSTWMFRGDDRIRDDREPAALHRQQVEGPQEPAHPGCSRDSPQALHPSHRASRLPLRAEPPLRVRPVPARTRLRPGRTRRADHAPRHLARLPQPAAPQRQRPRNPHLLQTAAEADAQAGLAAPAQERQGRPVRARPPRLRRRALPGRTTSPRTPPCPATSPAASGSTYPS